MSSKLLEKIAYLREVVKSVTTLKLQILERIAECRQSQIRCIDMDTQLARTLLLDLFDHRSIRSTTVPLSREVDRNYEGFSSKFNNFDLKLEHLSEKKRAAWEEIEPAMSTKIDNVTPDELVEIEKKLDHAITKIDDVKKEFQLFVMEWDSINLKEEFDALTRQIDMLLQHVQLN
ncbi:unnamed protein product [Orchesella dallaii]|uniref:Uncharacterized protein n=1 Tax=Orchesella dallaii TaxID=48710 RepID=A0ABP1QLP5_9HEXA